MDWITRLRLRLGYRVIVMGEAVLPSEFRRLQKAVNRAGVTEMHRRIDALALDRSRFHERGTTDRTPRPVRPA